MQFTLQVMQLACIIAALLLFWESAPALARWVGRRQQIAGPVRQVDIALPGLALVVASGILLWPRVFAGKPLDPISQPGAFTIAGLFLFGALVGIKFGVRRAGGRGGLDEEWRVILAVAAVAVLSTAIEWGSDALVAFAVTFRAGL